MTTTPALRRSEGDRFIGDAADAVASAVVSRPGWCAAGLLVAAGLFGNLPFAAGAAAVAGAAIRRKLAARGESSSRLAVELGIALAAGIVPRLPWTDLNLGADTTSSILFAAVVVFTSLRHAGVGAILCAAVGLSTVQTSNWAASLPGLSGAAVAATSCLAVALAARGRWRLAYAPLLLSVLLGAAAWSYVTRPDDAFAMGAHLIAVTFASIAPVVGGAAAARIDAGAEADEATRLLVFCRRRSGVVAVAGMALLAATALPFRRLLTGGDAMAFSGLIVLAVTVSLLAESVAANADAFARITTAAAASLAGPLFITIASEGQMTVLGSVAGVVLFLYPAVVGAIPMRRATGSGVLLAAALGVGVGVTVTGGLHGSAESWCAIGTIAAAVLAVHAAAQTETSALRLVVAASLFGLVTRAGLGMTERAGDRVALTYVALTVAWALAALAAVGIRRARSLTVIPADHPIERDFGANFRDGPQER